MSADPAIARDGWAMPSPAAVSSALSARVIAAAIVTAIAFACFAAFYHLAILDPHNVGWLLQGTDNGENLIGSHAWWNDPAARGLTTTLLNAPEGVPILFTDSNPLLTMLTAPLAAAMGPGVQFLGPWILACLILHAGFAHALLKPHAPGSVALWAGVALVTLMPTLYGRYIHINLQAHWLILAAFWLFVDDRRARNGAAWAVLLGATALIHNYLLLMVAAVWGSAMLRGWFADPAAKARARLCAGAIGALGVTIVAISRLSISTDFVSTYTFGRYGMPIDALWNPHLDSFSTLLPAFEQRKYRQFEGFQYLGAGLLLIVAIAPFIVRRAGSPLWQTLRWFVPAGVVLTALAVTHEIDFSGRTIATLPLPRSIVGALDPIRASARLFWPVAYALVLWAITAAYRLPRGTAARLLAAALVVQVLDLTMMMRSIRAVTADAPAKQTYTITTDARWDRAIAAARDVTFAPGDATWHLALFQELAWRATLAGKPFRHVYAARNTRATDRRLDAEYADFKAGRLVPDRLYILLSYAKVPPGAEARLAVLNGNRVLLPVGMARPAR